MIIKVIGLSIVVMLVFGGVMLILQFTRKAKPKGDCCGGSCSVDHIDKHPDSGCNCQ